MYRFSPNRSCNIKPPHDHDHRLRVGTVHVPRSVYRLHELGFFSSTSTLLASLYYRPSETTLLVIDLIA